MVFDKQKFVPALRHLIIAFVGQFSYYPDAKPAFFAYINVVVKVRGPKRFPVKTFAVVNNCNIYAFFPDVHFKINVAFFAFIRVFNYVGAGFIKDNHHVIGVFIGEIILLKNGA